MNYMKKLGKIIICIVLAVGLLATPVYADVSDYDVVLAVNTVKDASNPDYVDVEIRIIKNTGIHILQFEVNYNTDAYEIVGNNKLDDSEYFFSEDLSAYPYYCNWYHSYPGIYTDCDEFVTLRFKIKDSAAPGNYEFTLDNIKAKDFGDFSEIKKSVFADHATDSIVGYNISGKILTWDQVNNIKTYIYSEESSDLFIRDDIMQNNGKNAYCHESSKDAQESIESTSKYPYQSAINLSVPRSAEPKVYKLAVFKPGYAVEIRSILVSKPGINLERDILLSKLGDVSNNGKTNITDVAWLTHYIANWEDYKKIDLKAADVDGNGEVNLRDITVLERHLANWRGYEDLPYVE